jgi:hypothetical protein
MLCTAPRVAFLEWRIANGEVANRERCAPYSLFAISNSLYPRNGGGVGDPEALRHCDMLSAITFIDAAAVWLTVA